MTPNPHSSSPAGKRAVLSPRTAVWLAAALLAGCGGGNSVNVSDVTPKVPLVQAHCTMDMTVQPSVEEQRLPNKLSATDTASFSQQLLQTSGFDRFGPEFASTLCRDGLAGASSYDEAMTLVKTEGQKLWQAALDRVQGRKVEGSLPQSDDRMLYWARLTMTLALRQWMPDFALSEQQREALQYEFERASRGQYAIDFPQGNNYRRILISGFDPFTLGDPGKDGDLSIRIGNPSGAIALALNGDTVKLDDGTTAVIQTYLLPVNYPPFLQGMQEDTIGPWFKPGDKRVDASITISQGGSRSRFDLEHFNGRYQLASIPGNDNVWPSCPTYNKYPSVEDCDIYPPERWFGSATRPWAKDSPPQFTQSTLPFKAMIDANSGDGITFPGVVENGWRVMLNNTYSVQDCRPNAVGPLDKNCAERGGGGNYLSNASAYRNTLMRDVFKLDIPAGHIHTPIMTNFSSGSDDLITDATFEGYRDGIVAQSRNLVFALAKTLVPQAPPAP